MRDRVCELPSNDLVAQGGAAELYTLTFQVTLEERRTIQRVLNDVAQGQGERNELLDTLCGEWDALNKSHKKILRLVA